MGCNIFSTTELVVILFWPTVCYNPKKVQFRETIILTSKDKNFDILTEFLAFEYRYSWNYLYINCTISPILVHHVVRLPSIIISSYNYIFYFDFGRHSKTTQTFLGPFSNPLHRPFYTTLPQKVSIAVCVCPLLRFFSISIIHPFSF